MKRLSVRVLFSILAIGMFAATVLWSDPSPAVFRFATTVLTGTIPIYALNEANTDLTIDAQGWLNLDVEARFALKTITRDGSPSYYIAENGKWAVDETWYDPGKFPMTLSAFQSGKMSPPPLAEVAGEDLEIISIDACFRLKNGSPGSSQCQTSSWMLRKTQINPTVSDTALKTASIRFSSGVNLGQVALKEPKASQRASFDLSIPKDGQAAALAFYPDLTSADLPNTSLNGVTVSVYELKSDGTPATKPSFVITHGKSEMTDGFSMGAELVEPPAAFKAKMTEIIQEAGIDRLSQAERVALLENNARNEFFTTQLNDAKVREAGSMLADWSANLIRAIGVPFGTGSTQGKWMAGIWHPTATSYRVVVETESGVRPFGLFASLIPYEPNPGDPSIPPVNEFLVNDRELTWATTTLAQQLGIRAQIHGFDNWWPGSLDDLSPNCRSMVESGPAKAFASGVFGAMSAGVVGKVVGSIGGIAGISEQAITHSGEVAAWVASSIFDGVNLIDTAKFHLAYYAANAFAWRIARVTAVKLPEKSVYCVGKPLWVDTVWYNQCGQPVWSHGSQNKSMYGISPAENASVELLGPVTATTLPLVVTAIDSGVGARYRITGLKPGRVSMVFKVTGTDQTQDLEINFKKCTSKELEQY